MYTDPKHFGKVSFSKKNYIFRQLEGVEKTSRRMRFLSWKPAAVRQLDKARAVKGSDGLFRKVRTNCIIL